MNPVSLSDNIIFQAGEFSKEFSDLLTRRFKEKGIDVSSEQFSILTVLWFQDGMTQKELSEQLNRDKTTISRVIDSMIKRDLIIREVDETDKRSRNIFLTEKGTALQAELISISGNLYTQCLDGIPESSIKITLFTLYRMRKNLI